MNVHIWPTKHIVMYVGTWMKSFVNNMETLAVDLHSGARFVVILFWLGRSGLDTICNEIDISLPFKFLHISPCISN